MLGSGRTVLDRSPEPSPIAPCRAFPRRSPSGSRAGTRPIRKSRLSVRFDDFPLHPALIASLFQHGKTAPTPFQATALPALCDGEDLLAVAPSGCGKTLAYGLPLLSFLDPGDRPQALVVVPDRAAAEYVMDALAELLPATSLRVAAFLPGVGTNPQIVRLKAGVDVCVGTPTRLLDLHKAKALDLRACRIVVFDGLDAALRLGAKHEVAALLEATRHRQQTAAFVDAPLKQEPAGLFLPGRPLHRLTVPAPAPKPAAGSRDKTSRARVAKPLTPPPELERLVPEQAAAGRAPRARATGPLPVAQGRNGRASGAPTRPTSRPVPKSAGTGELSVRVLLTEATGAGDRPSAGELLSASLPGDRPPTGPLAPLPRFETTWRPFKLSLKSANRPSREKLHKWLSDVTGVPRSAIRSIVIEANFATLEVEGRASERFLAGLEKL